MPWRHCPFWKYLHSTWFWFSDYWPGGSAFKKQHSCHPPFNSLMPITSIKSARVPMRHSTPKITFTPAPVAFLSSNFQCSNFGIASVLLLNQMCVKCSAEPHYQLNDVLCCLKQIWTAPLRYQFNWTRQNQVNKVQTESSTIELYRNTNSSTPSASLKGLSQTTAAWLRYGKVRSYQNKGRIPLWLYSSP